MWEGSVLVGWAMFLWEGYILVGGGMSMEEDLSTHWRGHVHERACLCWVGHIFILGGMTFMQEVCLCLRHVLVREGVSLCEEACPCGTGCVLDGGSISLREGWAPVGGVFLGLVMSVQERCPCGKGHLLWKRTFPLGMGLLLAGGANTWERRHAHVKLGVSLWEGACPCGRRHVFAGGCFVGGHMSFW